MKRTLSIPQARKQLLALRKKIDGLDNVITRALQSRMKMAAQAGKIKQRAGLPVRDATREKALRQRIGKLASQALSRTTLMRVYQVILSESRRLQRSR